MNQLQYIQYLLEKTGWSRAELAKRAGLDPTTLSRFLSSGDVIYQLRGSTIRRLELVSGIAFGESPSSNSEPLVGFSEVEVIPFSVVNDHNIMAAFEALHPGAINKDIWVLRSRALELVGYRPGDLIQIKLDIAPLRGDVVCAQVYDEVKSRAQTVFRIYAPPILASATTDLGLGTPYSLDDNRVVVKGVVVAMLRTRTTINPGFSED
jgi:transcriptional regulator with XRE-family HTH domain